VRRIFRDDWPDPESREIYHMARSPVPGGMTVLEILIAMTILAGLIIPTFHLFSVQRHQVANAQRDVFLHAYGLQRLAEEESRLNIARFSLPTTSAIPVDPPGNSIKIEETLSVSRVETCTGLWRLQLEMTYADASSRGVSRNLSLTKWIVNRDLPASLPITNR